MSTKIKPLALLGGSFDPIHYGHIKPALEVTHLLNIDKIRLLPNRVSPLKQLSSTSQAHKLQMLQLVAAQYPEFEIDPRELTQDKPNYTVQTLQAIRKEIGPGPLCFIMGYDSLVSLPRWHQWRQLLDYAHLVVCRRPEQQSSLAPELAELLKQVGSHKLSGDQGNIICVNTQAQPISSTLIRDKIKKKQSIKGLMPSSVATYIAENRLYLDE